MSEMPMIETQFRADLEAGGYEVREVTWEAGQTNDAHAHEFSAKLLCVAGSVQIFTDSGERTYKVGEHFEMSAGAVHREVAGAEGARLVVGRKY